MSKIVHARLDQKSHRMLDRIARRTGWPASTIIRRGLRALADLTLTLPGKRIIGLGAFESGIADLGSNKKHLKGLGR